MMANSNTVNLARSTIPCRCHVCAFFSSADEEYPVLLPFMKDGLLAGDSSVQIVNKEHYKERKRRLAEAGIASDAAEQSGQLEIRPWENAYLRDGKFEQDRMIDLLAEVGSAGEKRGSGFTRLWANMEWALEDFPGTRDLVEYESRLNYVLPKYNMATVCTYDLAKFGAAVMMDIMRTHPLVIIGGILHENPFYVPPDEFLRELQGRKARAH
jgi:hypothetical protein